MDLYVYYRVKSDAAAALHPRVLAMQDALAARHSIRPGLKRRPEEKNGEQTWMEIYPGVDDSFIGLLEQAVSVAGLAELVPGPRHTEVFIDVLPCA